MDPVFADLYDAFNARDLDRLLAAMAEDVDWPNGWEGGRLVGHAALRDYWTRQWAAIDPKVFPVRLAPLDDGRVAVTVRQVVRSRDGALLADQMVDHVYALEDGRIASMEIRNPEPPP